jgi:ATPase involved in DNA replication initiation
MRANQESLEESDRVLEFLAHRITSNIRELESALTRLFAFTTLVHRQIDMEMAEDVLRDLLRANNRRIALEEIQRKVAEHYNIRLSDMHSARRSQAIARPRQIAMFLCKVLTQRSLPDIGRKFGGRDHTTVIHAIKKVTELMEKDQNIREDVTLLRRALED